MAGTVNALIACNQESFSFLYQETIDSFHEVWWLSREAFGGIGAK